MWPIGREQKSKAAAKFETRTLRLLVYECLERETGLEPATSSLGSWHSTTELLPQIFNTGRKRAQLTTSFCWSQSVAKFYQGSQTAIGRIFSPTCADFFPVKFGEISAFTVRF